MKTTAKKERAQMKRAGGKKVPDLPTQAPVRAGVAQRQGGAKRPFVPCV